MVHADVDIDRLAVRSVNDRDSLDGACGVAFGLLQEFDKIVRLIREQFGQA